MPIWYQYTPGGEPWVLTGNGSRKHRLIETQGEFTLMADRVEPTVRYVAVDGPVSRIEPGTDEQLVELTKRYLPPDKVDAYLEFARREHGESVAIYLKPSTGCRPTLARSDHVLATTAVPDPLPARLRPVGRPPAGEEPEGPGRGRRQLAATPERRSTSVAAPVTTPSTWQARLASHRRGLRRQAGGARPREGRGQQGDCHLRPGRCRPA